MAKQTIAQKMGELSKNHKYNKIINQIKEAAKEGKNTLPVFKANITEIETQKLLIDGFTLETKDYRGYNAFEISW